MNWIQGIQRAIDYVEANITEDINYEEVAKQVLLDVVLLTADNVNDYTDFIEENVCTVE